MEFKFFHELASLSPASLALTALTIAVLVAYFVFLPSDLPPGPVGIPILGYWPFLNDKQCHLQLDALKKKYGDVFSFMSSQRLYINLGSVKAIREAHLTKGDCFGSRAMEYSLLYHSFLDGVPFSNGEPWKVLRKFFIQVLKERTTAAIKGIESRSLYDSVEATIERLKNKKGEPENIVMLLTDKCNAILRETLFGTTGMSEEQVQEINKHYSVLSEAMTPTNWLLSGNIAKLIFSLKSDARNGLRSHKHIEEAIYKVIEDHKSSFNEDNARDIIDDYLKERNIRRSNGDLTAQYFTDKALMSTLVLFIGDGVLAVAVFVAYFLKCVIDHPEEQQKMYEELLEVVGEDRQPTFEDKSKLTYTNAFILEVLRMYDLFPIFPSQECTRETTVCGYRIPVGAITLMNSFSAHFDPEVFKEPGKFNPSRYMVQEGKKRAELPVTFGIGKRSCIGEGYVMLQVFLFLTSLVKNFKLSMTKETDYMFLDLFQGKVEICALPRNKKM